MGRVTRNHPVVRISADGSVLKRADTVAVEEPLEIRLDGRPWLVTMRTPGDDIDLVHGLLHAEGIIAAAADVVLARYCAGTGPDGLNTYNVIDVSLGAEAVRPSEESLRHVAASSACGMCGAVRIEEITRSSRYPLDWQVRRTARFILGAPDLLRAEQKAFDRTGGLHGAGLLDTDGSLLCVREDVGRHNAVDKVIGWALREGRLPLSEAVLVVSSRASFELTQKALLAGIPLMVAVSAPSSLAVELAAAAGLTLVGFARGTSMNVYTHADRIETTVVARTT